MTVTHGTTLDVLTKRCKRCTGPCGLVLTLDMFHRSKRGLYSRKSWCKPCSLAKTKMRRNANLEQYRMAERLSRRRIYAANPEKFRGLSADYRLINQEKCKKSKKIYHARWKISASPRDKFARHIRNKKYKYGIQYFTIDDFDLMAAKQNNSCKGCGRRHSELPNGVGKYSRLHIDHDHATGQVRRLLCLNCNMFLGMVEKDPDRTVKLLKENLPKREFEALLLRHLPNAQAKKTA